LLFLFYTPVLKTSEEIYNEINFLCQHEKNHGYKTPMQALGTNSKARHLKRGKASEQISYEDGSPYPPVLSLVLAFRF
jgi:hypothetical protein